MAWFRAISANANGQSANEDDSEDASVDDGVGVDVSDVIVVDAVDEDAIGITV